jgi:hypothetical protein
MPRTISATEERLGADRRPTRRWRFDLLERSRSLAQRELIEEQEFVGWCFFGCAKPGPDASSARTHATEYCCHRHWWTRLRGDPDIRPARWMANKLLESERHWVSAPGGDSSNTGMVAVLLSHAYLRFCWHRLLA